LVRADLGQTLTAVAEGCHCAGSVACTTRFTGERTLAIDTLFCEDPSIDCDCFEENPVTRFHCSLPPLAVGTWSVTVDSRAAFLLEAVEGPIPPERPAGPDICWVASPREDPEARPCSWPSSTDLLVAGFCHDGESVAGANVEIEVEGVNSCEHDRADCEVTVVGGACAGTRVPCVVNGHTVGDPACTWIHYVGRDVVPRLAGTRDQALTAAAAVAWWSLKEGVLSLQNPIVYSNCNFASGDAKEYMGTVAADNPWEFLNKATVGQPGEHMPSGLNLGWSIQDAVDVMKYAQTLPIE